MNIKQNCKKLLAIFISLFVFNSFVLNDCLFAFTQPIVQTSVLNPSQVMVNDSFIARNNIMPNNKTVIFIQDLHGNVSVQQNISEILKTLEDQYGIDSILLEGVPQGEANLTVLNSLKKLNISDLLLQKNVLSGPEYYLMNYDTKAKIYGLEDFDIYMKNINRAAEILKDKKYILENYDNLKRAIYDKIPNSKNLKKYINFDLSDINLFKTIKQPILKYKDLHSYIVLSDEIKNLNSKKINNEYISFLKELQQNLSISQYTKIISLSKKKDLSEYYDILLSEISKDEYKKQFKNLYLFLKDISEKSKLNMVSLISQQNLYFQDYLTSISNDKTSERIFILKMTELLYSFLQLSISDEEYTFFVNNYERFINLLSKYLAQDYFEYEDILHYDTIFDYHQTNKDRNKIFIDIITKTLKNKDNKLSVVVAGGFHSSILKSLKDNNISYLLLTPTIKTPSNTKFYNQIVCSTLTNANKNALAPIKIMLANTKGIPSKTIDLFFDNLIEALISLSNNSPEEVKNKILEISRNKLIFGIPITIDIDYELNSFNININKQILQFDIENNKIVWESHIDNLLDYKLTGKEDSLFSRIITNIKKKFNIFQATSMKLSKYSNYSAKLFSKRLGNRKDPIFSMSMFFSFIKQYNIAYKLMMGFAKSQNDSTLTYKIDFNSDEFDDIRDMKEFEVFKGKKINIIVENGLENYIKEPELIEILKKSIKRIDEPISDFKDTIFIGFLSKSTNLFEDHLNNGFIGINEGILQINNEFVKKALLEAGIIHEFSHELKGPLNTARYKVFEERMMFSDIKFIIDYIAQNKYHQSIESLMYTNDYDIMINDIIETLLTPVEEPSTKQRNALFNSNIRFLRKLKNYKYNIKDIASFVKRKDFSVEDRRGQLKHIENEFLKDNTDAQQELFSNLIRDSYEDIEPLEIFLEHHISITRREEVSKKISDLLDNLSNTLNSSDISIDIQQRIRKEFEENIAKCLETMYKKMPPYIFGRFYSDEGVIPDHALNHSIELLNSAIKILSKDTIAIPNLDVKTIVYSAFMHDISCTLSRLNHEQNSATWAKSILQGELSDEEIEKIYQVCLGHKKAKNGEPREEHKKYYEARLIHDADGLAAALDLERILKVWLNSKDEPFYVKTLSIEKRRNLIDANKYLAKDGGDAINDLMRQFLRRNPSLYLTSGAKDIITASTSNPYAVKEFFYQENIIKLLKEYKVPVDSLDEIAGVIDTTLSHYIPTYYKEESTNIISDTQSDESAFDLKQRFNLFKKILAYKTFKKLKVAFKQNFALSDIHGGYSRLSELIIKLFDPTYDMTGKTDAEINDDIISRLYHMGKDNLYVLGDLLDRGDKQVEAFILMNKISNTGKMRYVIGNHDLYAFMNLLGLHLPFYDNYKGISDTYIDFKGRKVKEDLEKRRKQNSDLSQKEYWAKILMRYMEYADAIQNEWKSKELELQSKFTETFGFTLDNKQPTDVLNAPEQFITEEINDETKNILSDTEFINFHKKFFGRNVGVVVYTGIRAVGKMSINWWLDRKEELIILKEKYPKYNSYWNTIENEIDTILKELKVKFEEEERTNLDWGVIDAIMYRNYESTEWNALDWVYHNKWGGGKEGFIEQRNTQLKNEGKSPIDRETYFEDPLIKDLAKFYQKNFYLYRVDEYGICYMHSLLPVDDDGDVSLGYVDKDGVFHERDRNGKRVKGFIYKGKQYKGKKIFKGLKKIAKDVRNYNASSNNLSDIQEALTLLTAIYADNTTRIKPPNLKEMKRKFGFEKILAKKGITTMIVGHNPINKVGAQFEYVTLRFFNKEFKIINLIHIDGNMSSGYAAPKGAGLVIKERGDGGIVSEGFKDGHATEITTSSKNNVSTKVFINSVLLNLFPIAKKVLLFTEKLYDKYDLLRQTFNSNFARKGNTTLINIIDSENDLYRAEDICLTGTQTIPIVPNRFITDIKAGKQNLETVNLLVNGKPIQITINLCKIKVATREILSAISIDYSEDEDIDILDIEQVATNYILEQLQNNKYKKYIKLKKHILIDTNFEESFEQEQNISTKFNIILENNYGIIPALYDLKSKKSSIENLATTINLDKIKDILSAA